MDLSLLSEKTNRYIENTIQMRKLSSSDIENVKSGEEYICFIEQNHLQIETMAKENKAIMTEYISPLLREDFELTDELSLALNDFCEKLLDVYDMVDVDLPILMRVSEKLLQDARRKQDADYLVSQLDLNVIANYAMMNQFKRNTGDSRRWKKYQENGLKSIDTLLTFMEEKAFLSLQEESSREKVLIATRYFCTLYDNDETSGEEAEMIYERLREAYDIADQTFFVMHAPNYDWNRHRMKTLEYMGQLTENNNLKSCSQSLCQRICPYMALLEQLFWQDPEQNKELISEYDVRLLHMRAGYFAGELSKEKYKQRLTDLYDEWALEKNPVYAIYCYDLLPLEYIALLDKGQLTELEKSQLDKMYQNALNFAMRSESNGSLSFFLEYFIGLLYAFIEIPEGTHFESLVLGCFVSIYPPAYVHALMSAKLARCLCSHLVKLRPDLFIGMHGLHSKEEVAANSNFIIDFAYHGALIHDVGLLAMIENMMVYGRDLTEEEASAIQYHPEIGYKLVTGKQSVEQYRNVILGHHKWYDNSKGYPAGMETWNSGEKTVIDIMSCVEMLLDYVDFADRDDSDSRNLKAAIAQIEEAGGSRLASFFSWFLEVPEVVADLRYLLTRGVEQVYTETYIRIHEIEVKKEHTFF